MSTSRLRHLGVALTCSLALLASAGSANAAIACSLSAGTLTVTTDEQLAILRSGDDIIVTGASCAGSPTVLNTAAVVVTGSLEGPEHVDVNQSGGAFGDIDFDLTQVVFANGAALIVTGTSGADTITLGELGLALDTDGDVDVLLPGAVGQIRILGGSGDDTIATTGGNGAGGPPSGRNVYAAGGAGADTIDLTDGDGGPGADLAEGGPGDDTITGDFADGVLFANAPGPTGAVIDIAAGTATSGDGTDTFAPLRSVFGTQFADTITGTGLPDVIFGFGGADEIDARESQDTVDAGDGDDVIDAGTGEDAVTGGPGDDTLRATFLAGFTAQLDGADGMDRYELFFDGGGGSIAVTGGAGDDEVTVDCTAGTLTNTPGAPGAGTLSREDETATYTGVETVTIMATCLAPAVQPPGAGGIVIPPVASPGAPAIVDPGSEPAATSSVELGAVIALVERGLRLLRFDARASFLVETDLAVEPRTWSWRIRHARRTLLHQTAWVDLHGAGLARSRVRARIAVGDGHGRVWTAQTDLPARMRRTAVIELPAATLASATGRALVVDRTHDVLGERRWKELTRILPATSRAVELAAGTRAVAARLVVTAPSLRWVDRLERLPATRLRQGVDGRRIVLSHGATLRLVSTRSGSRATLVFRRR